MKPEVFAKLVKAATVIAAIAGVEVSPEQITAVLEAAGVILSTVYTVEAWLKSRVGK